MSADERHDTCARVDAYRESRYQHPEVSMPIILKAFAPALVVSPPQCVADATSQQPAPADAATPPHRCPLHAPTPVIALGQRAPSSDDTRQAAAFRADRDFTSGAAPTHNKGDPVWAYRKRSNGWVEATVSDARSVLADGNYLVRLVTGAEVEAYEQTLRCRSHSQSHSVKHQSHQDASRRERGSASRRCGSHAHAPRAPASTRQRPPPKVAQQQLPPPPIIVRLPNASERRWAEEVGIKRAFGARGTTSKSASVWLSEEEALRRVHSDAMKMFDECDTLSGNIHAARRWASSSAVQWNVNATPFVVGSEPAGLAPPYDHPGTRCRDDGCARIRVRSSESDDSPRLSLSEVLSHKQVSHVRPVSKRTKARMDTYRTCTPSRMFLDLRGKTACQVQRDLRASLVQDLVDGSDEAAFVCRQLGIDQVPRADQIELMIAAMPGALRLVFDGDPVESGLDLAYWQQMHATHCTKGCTASVIDPDCYFKTVHHFLSRGYDPELCSGCSWDDFATKQAAYVDAWRKEDSRCKTAWDKWKEQAAALLTAPSATEPKLVVPLLPASRSKHVWRYHKYGTPYKVRLCLDLKSAQVNEATEDWKFRYRGLHDIAEKLQRGDWLASVDISRFYLRLPAGKNLRRAQWVQDPDTYAKTSKLNRKSTRKRWRQLKAIGFGLKTAPAWASVVSAELVRILEAAGVRVVGCFLDDLLIAGKTQTECRTSLHRATAIMAKLGIPANEKTVLPRSPHEGITFLGVHIRTHDMRFTISEEHRAYAADRVQHAISEKVATKGDLASIAGVLTWISFVFTPGRPRRQHIYNATRLGETGRKSDKVVVEGPLQRQLQWWLNSLSRSSFVGSRVWDCQASPRTLLLHSDASGVDGWGACIGNLHFAGPWPVELQDAHMLFKEMFPVVLVIALLSYVLDETVFGVAVDNTGVAFSVNRLSCRDGLTSRLLQQLTSDMDGNGHTALSAHARRHRNQHADDMSHALPTAWWHRIVKQQQSRSSRFGDNYWFFPFVAQCVITGECFSGSFRMRKSLFSSKA